jgi:hypothetical protein
VGKEQCESGFSIGGHTSFGVFTDIMYALIVGALSASILTSFKHMGIEVPGK